MSETGAPARVYTMAELEADTYGVLAKIGAGGPALITRHGRWLAMIVPMDDEAVMSRVIDAGPFAEMLRDRLDQIDAADAADVAADIDVDAR